MPKVSAPSVLLSDVNERGQPNQTEVAITLPSGRQKRRSDGSFAVSQGIRVHVRVNLFWPPHKTKIVQVFVAVYKQLPKVL
jgi:hypothetical protein